MSAFLFFSSCLLFFIKHFDSTEKITQLREYTGDVSWTVSRTTFRDTAPDTLTGDLQDKTIVCH